MPDLKNKARFIVYQLISLAVVASCFIFWGAIEFFNPEFFSPFQWCPQTKNILLAIAYYWPLFLYGGIMALVIPMQKIDRWETKESHFILDSVISTLAGIWEELGYRCVFILTAMIGIIISNLFFSWLLVIMMLVTLGGVIYFRNAVLSVLGIIIVILLMVLIYFTWDIQNPVYLIYSHITFPVLSFISFGWLDSILYFKNAPFLFIAGAISANANFRDGHKYQGLLGQINAWIIGFCLLYAMFYYGLLVVIMVHALYDIIIAFITYRRR